MSDTIQEAAENHSTGSFLEDTQYNHTMYNSFYTGALSPEAKEYHTKGLYTEEEVIALCSELHVDHIHGNFYEWFNQNKKK